MFEGHIAPTLHCSQAFIGYGMTFVVGALNEQKTWGHTVGRKYVQISQRLCGKIFFIPVGLAILLVAQDGKSTDPQHCCESVLTLCGKTLLYRLNIMSF